jgi:hypothetical protein
LEFKVILTSEKNDNTAKRNGQARCERLKPLKWCKYALVSLSNGEGMHGKVAGGECKSVSENQLVYLWQFAILVLLMVKYDGYKERSHLTFHLEETNGT